MEQSMFKRKSIIKEWGISYALILMIPIIAIFINYNFNVKALKEETIQAYELMLNNLTDNVDNIVESQHKMFTSIYLDSVFVEFMKKSDASKIDYSDIYALKNQLSSYELSDDIASFWVYLDNIGYLILENEAYSSQHIYKARQMQQNKYLDYEEWQRIWQGEYLNTYFFSDILGTKTCLIYANSYYSRNGEKANILCAADVSVIEDIAYSLPEGTVIGIYTDNKDDNVEKNALFIDSRGEIRLDNGSEIKTVEAKEEALGLANHVKLTASSSNKKLNYHLFIPQETFWEAARWIRRVHIFTVCATCFVGIGLVIFLLRRNSRPVYNLLESIGDVDEELYEFEQLEKVYAHMKTENNSMKRTLESQEKSLTSSYLLSLLKGRRIKNSKLEEQLGLDLSCRKGCFVLIGFYIPIDEESAEYDELPFFVLDNIFSEIMSKEEFYRIEDGCFLFYLLRTSEEHITHWEEEILKNVGYLCEFLEGKLKVDLSAAVSEIEQDISCTRHMYQSVMAAFEYKKIIGGSGVIKVDEQADLEENQKYQGYYRALVHALENNLINEAYDVLEQIFADAENLAFVALRLRALEIYQAIADIYNTYIIDSVKRIQLLSRLETILNAENKEELKICIEDVLAYAYTKMRGQWEGEDRGIVHTILEYIEHNYTDSNLNITTIAEEVNRNPRYISTLFRKETGEGILDYVNRLRIRKAQEILLNSKVTLEELSNMVGYSNVRTFRRAFSKIVGMVPSSYLEKNN